MKKIIFSMVVLLFLFTGCAHFSSKPDGNEVARTLFAAKNGEPLLVINEKDLMAPSSDVSTISSRSPAVDPLAFFNALLLPRITTINGVVVTVQEPTAGYNFPLSFIINNPQMAQGKTDLFAFVLLKDNKLCIARRDDTIEYMLDHTKLDPVYIEWRSGERFIPFTTVSVSGTILKVSDAFRPLTKELIAKYGIVSFLFGSGPAGALQKGDVSKLNIVVFNLNPR